MRLTQVSLSQGPSKGHNQRIKNAVVVLQKTGKTDMTVSQVAEMGQVINN